MRYYTIDRSKYPIVIIKINPINPNDEQFDEYFKDVTQVIKEMNKGILIHILTDAKFLSADKRIKIGSLFKSEAELLKKNLAGMAYVNSSLIPQTLLKGIFLVNKPPLQHTVVSTLDEALRWAEQQIELQKFST